MPSLMTARCLGQNSGPIFCRFWTKVNRIKFACAVRECPLLATPFPIDDVLLRSGDIREQVGKLCKIGPKF